MSKPTYSEQLRDPRWQRRRLAILNRSDFSCEECGDASSTLNVHHRIYRRGAAPWEYEDDELRALCENCHQAEHQIRGALTESMARMRLYTLSQLLGFAEGLEARIAVFDEPRPQRRFRFRSPGHVRGFLEALWGYVTPETQKKVADLGDIELGEVETIMRRGPII